MKTEPAFLEEIHSFALIFLFLKSQATSYSLYSTVTVRWKEENLIENHAPFPIG